MKFFLLALTLFGCARTPKTTIQGTVFCMPFQLQVTMKFNQAQLQKELKQIFNQVNQELNHFNKTSILSSFNRAKKNESITVTPLILELLQEAQEIYDITEARFDPTLYDLTKLKITGNQITKLCDALKLDLNAQAKGKALDLIANRLESLHIKDYIMNWAGEIITASSLKPSLIRIEGSCHKIALMRAALATSGGAKLSKEGQTHFYNTAKCRLIELQDTLFESITVVSKSCSLSDALATSAFLYPETSSLYAWIKEVKKKVPCQFYLLKKDKTLIVK
jgi:FAD:protein FMN transferase